TPNEPIQPQRPGGSDGTLIGHVPAQTRYVLGPARHLLMGPGTSWNGPGESPPPSPRAASPPRSGVHAPRNASCALPWVRWGPPDRPAGRILSRPTGARTRRIRHGSEPSRLRPPP